MGRRGVQNALCVPQTVEMEAEPLYNPAVVLLLFPAVVLLLFLVVALQFFPGEQLVAMGKGIIVLSLSYTEENW